MAIRILIVDDAPQIRRVLRTALVAREYEVETAASGEEALEAFRKFLPQMVILDLVLPGMGGVEVCKQIRQTSTAPIIVLSVRDAEAEKVRALDAGADDYITKPFGAEELLARIRSALRRSGAGEAPATVQLDGLTIDFDRRAILEGGEETRLTPKEFELLRYLTSHAGRVLTHRTLLQAVWGPDYGEQNEYLRVLVNQLRRKIERDPAKPKHLITEPWVGYRFVLPG